MDADALPPRWGEYAYRLPKSLEDLKGPAAGTVELPLHVAWSGRRADDVGEEDQRLVLYALLLAEAQREDLERFVHRDSLVSMWPRLRRLLGPHARREWERQLALRLPDSGDELEMDLLKEALEPRWVTVQLAPAASVRALSLDDTVGLKVRAWHDRFVIRDIIDLHAVASTFSYIDLENLGRRHDPDLDLEAILDHLGGVSVFPDDDFTEYGLGEPKIAELRRWATGWYDDLACRIAAEHADDELPSDP